jgi:hypothetical protein
VSADTTSSDPDSGEGGLARGVHARRSEPPRVQWSLHTTRGGSLCPVVTCRAITPAGVAEGSTSCCGSGVLLAAAHPHPAREVERLLLAGGPPLLTVCGVAASSCPQGEAHQRGQHRQCQPNPGVHVASVRHGTAPGQLNSSRSRAWYEPQVAIATNWRQACSHPDCWPMTPSPAAIDEGVVAELTGTVRRAGKTLRGRRTRIRPLDTRERRKCRPARAGRHRPSLGAIRDPTADLWRVAPALWAQPGRGKARAPEAG